MRRALNGAVMAAVVTMVAAPVMVGCAAGGPGATTPTAADNNPIGDIPDNQVYVAYAPPGSGYTITVPEGWARTAYGTMVTFTDKLNTIGLEWSPASSAPTVADGRVELATIRGAAHGFGGGEVSTVTRRAGSAVLLTYRADAAPDPVTGKVINDDIERYEFFHAGLRVTVTLSGPHGADNVDPWRTVTDSLAWTP